MHAGCRKRNVAEAQAGATGSEVLQLWGLPGSYHDPRLLKSPLVRC